MEKKHNHQLKIKYKTLSEYPIQSVMAKLTKSPVDNVTACHIHQIAKRVKAAHKAMMDQFLPEIRDVFAKRDEEGKIITTPALPYEIPDDKVLDYNKATEEFGERLAIIDYKPFTLASFKEIKITAEELDALGELVDLEHDDKGGPGLPDMGQDIMGKVHQLKN